MVKIQPDEILFIESQRDYVKIKTTQKEIVAHQTISYLEKQLPGEDFLRIHRSFIVRLDKIESWSSTDIELQETELPIGFELFLTSSVPPQDVYCWKVPM